VIRTAIIGTGAWGKNLFRNFLTMNESELRICCDIDGSRCSGLLAGVPEVACTTDPEDIFSSPDIDAVVIATPAPTHFELAKRAMEAGKDVFVEKPMTLALADAEELVRLSGDLDRILMVGHLLEYHPGVLKMKELLDSGELGDPYYLYSERVNLGKIRKDENALWSFAPHDISIILYLLGEEPVEVAARGAAYIQPGIEDVVFLWMRFGNNRIAQIHVSWLDPHKVRRTTLVGSRKMVVFDDMQAGEKIRVYDKGVNGNGNGNGKNGKFVGFDEALSLRFGEVTIPTLPTGEPLRIECLHFIECVENRTQPRSDGADGLRVVRVLDAAQRSLNAGGRTITLP
jgi:predicted dehydrogenase